MPLTPPGSDLPLTTVSGTTTSSLAVHVLPAYTPEGYVTVRLTNGDSFYSAGGTSVSGGGVLTADQGAPNTLGSAWPVKMTDGSSVFGPRTTPVHTLIVSGGIGVGVSQVGAVGALTVDVAQSVGVATPSGSVTGLLIGGQPVNTANPVPVVTTGAGLNTTSQTGSVTGLLQGGQAVSNANPIPVSDGGGSITVDGTVTIQDGGGSITVDGSVTATVVSTVITTGSVAGLLQGGQAVSNANPIPISDAGGAITVDGTVTSNQGTGGSIASPWPVLLVSGSDAIGTQSHPIHTTGTVTVSLGGSVVSNANPIPISDAGGSITVDGAVTGHQGTPAGLGTPWPVLLVSGSDAVGTQTHPLHATGSIVIMIGGSPISAANPMPISDGSGAITVDGNVNISNIPSVTAVSASVTGLLVGGQPLSNANPVPMTDAGGSITVDGTVTVTSTVINSGSVVGVLVGGQAASNANPLPISDAGESLTVDGSVTTLTGSVVGLLIGGVPLSNANPTPISDAGSSITVDGTVTVTQGTPAAIGSPWPVILVSGSDAVGTQTHPTWVTGSVAILNPGAAGSNVTALSGSVTGLLVGGVAVSNANPTPISDAGGSITVDGSVTATVASTAINSGSVTGLLVGGQALSNANPAPISDAGGSITVDGTVTATQGTAAGLGSPWPVILVSGSDAVGTQTHPTWITGSVFVLNPGGAGTNVIVQSGSVTGHLVGGLALSNANPFPISDAGGSITVDGAVTATVASTVINSGSVTGLLVGGGAVANSNPIPISDAGGSITVDGTVTVASTVINSGSVAGVLVGGQALSNANPVPISDAGGSITIDGAVTATVASTVINSGSVTGILVGGASVANSNPVPISDAGGSITVDGTVTVASTTINSGSVSGLLVGGLALSNANPAPISDAGGSITIDGTVTVTQGTPSALSAPWPVIIVSGSDVVGTQTNPTWVTGSVFVLNPGGAGTNVVTQTGSLVGHLVGGVALSNANPFPISDAGGSITVDGAVTATVASTAINSGSVTGLLVGGVALSNANPIPISDAGGTITVDGAVTAIVASTIINTGSVTGLFVGGVALSNVNPVPISDAGGAITVDGTVTVTSTVINSGSVSGLLVGGLALSNANPVPISDAGGTITVDGAVTATVASTVINTGSVTGLLVGGQPAASSNPVPSFSYDGTGQLYQAGTSRTVSYAFVDTATSGSTQVVAAQGASNKIRVLSVHVMAAGAVSVRFTATSGNKTAFYPLAANGGFVLPYNPQGWFETSTNEALNIGLSAAIVVGATITWIIAT